MCLMVVQPTDLILPSGKQYQLAYDEHGSLRQFVLPSLARHAFASLTQLGAHRLLYRAPEARADYAQDWNSAGQISQVC